MMSYDDSTNTAPARSRILRRAAYAALPVAALAAALLFARQPSTSANAEAVQAGAEDHSQHGAMSSGGAAEPVHIDAEQARRIGVTYAVAERAVLGREIRTVGQVTYDETRIATVALKFDAWVEVLHANVTGQNITAGAPLMAVYSPMLVAAQEELLLARTLERDVAAGTENARANAASLVASTRQRMELWDIPADEVAAIERSGSVRRAITLRAPVSGFVVEKNVLPGQRVMAGDPLYRIANLGTVWVEGEVYERDLSAVRVGQVVTVQVDALPGARLTGRITYVYPTIDAETRTSRVRVELPNPGTRLKPGMYATLSWNGAGVASAVTVPRSAVVSTGERHLVFVKRADGMLEPRLVRTGATTSDRIEVLSGVAAGDIVVRSATFLVDAESNLGTLMGGMGDMPGMDMTAPKKPEEPDAHANH